MKRSLSVNDVLPKGWRGYFSDRGRVGAGLDLGTTTKKKSNPTALALTQQVGLDYIVRLVVRWKTSDPEITKAILRQAFDLPHGIKVGKLCVDATNERYYAAGLRTSFIGKVIVVPVISSESIVHQGQTMDYKSYLGNLFINTCDDGRLGLPSEKWLEKDIRSVKSEKGTFDADIDEEGNHADCFDAIKLSLHALITAGGPARASAASVGMFKGGRPTRALKNPYAAKFQKRSTLAV